MPFRTHVVVPFVVLVLSLLAATPAAAQRRVLELVEALEEGAPVARIAAAEELRDLGGRARRAVPALVATLEDEDAALVDACIDALVAIGARARQPMIDVLEAEGGPDAALVRALLRVDEKGREAVDAWLAARPVGPALFAVFEGLDVAGAVRLAAAAEDPEHGAAALRSLRRCAAASDGPADALDAELADLSLGDDLRLAARLCWSGALPESGDDRARVEVWLAGGDAKLAETGAWLVGVAGPDAADLAGPLVPLVAHDEPLVAATAAFALGRLTGADPGDLLDFVAASDVDGGGAENGRAGTDPLADMRTVWANAGKSLGYRGRVGDQARKLWAAAPTWTGPAMAAHRPPTEADVPRPLRDAVPALVAGLEHADGRVRTACAWATAQAGPFAAQAMSLWTDLLGSDDVALRRIALEGMRAAGRHAIQHTEDVVRQLDDPRTAGVAADVLTGIATPEAWRAVSEHVAATPGPPSFELLLAMGRYDAEALRPALPKLTELYGEGHYVLSALLLRFGEQAVDVFVRELDADLIDRRMVAAESLGHLGSAARAALPRLRAMSERHPMARKLVADAIARIGG